MDPASVVDSYPRCPSRVRPPDAAEGSDGAAGVVSIRAEVPEALLGSMRTFIDAHPNWDQYRLFQAALAGFLVQNGVNSRAVTRCYIGNMFNWNASEDGCFSAR